MVRPQHGRKSAADVVGRGGAERHARTAQWIRTALALSFILLVSSELIAAREGLGYLIGFLGASGTYDAMFAVVLTVALLGFIADRIYLVLMQRMLRWQA
jgi:ABC-type nitrate/sulfonate/bicarbonate transport system permease component